MCAAICEKTRNLCGFCPKTFATSRCNYSQSFVAQAGKRHVFEIVLFAVAVAPGLEQSCHRHVTSHGWASESNSLLHFATLFVSLIRPVRRFLSHFCLPSSDFRPLTSVVPFTAGRRTRGEGVCRFLTFDLPLFSLALRERAGRGRIALFRHYTLIFTVASRVDCYFLWLHSRRKRLRRQ